ncbi:MAG: hypothetical protein JXX28_14880 [Deltaproteobacteria bacterium]|nr:hypothetical protein [Deltaproteobacteria bacterium]
MRTVWSSLAISSLLSGCTQDYDLNPEEPDVDPGMVTECAFSPIAGTKLSSYDCNPVFSVGESWGPSIDSVGFIATEVLGHPFYQMWYSGLPLGAQHGDWGLGYAVSANGTQWETHPQNPLLESSPGAWDQDAMSAIQIVWDPAAGRYIMAYQGYNVNAGDWGMGVATSPDGVSWSKLPSNPVMDFTDIWSDNRVCWPLTIRVSDTGSLTGFVAAHRDDFSEECEIYGTSAFGLDDWTTSNYPIITAGPEYFDASGMTSATVVDFEGTLYMFYIGFEEWVSYGSYQASNHHHLALATSTDGGITWRKDLNNPIPINNSPDEVINTVTAQVVGSRIHLWITDYYASEGGQAVGYFLFEPGIEDHPPETR